jgi:hypothetical protein
MRELHPVIVQTAAVQNGIVRLDQVTSRGVSRDSVQGDVDAGRVRRAYRGTYALPTPDEGVDRQQAQAALAHLGPEATLILRSALDVYGIQGALGPSVPQVALPPGHEKRQRAELDIHFWALNDDDITIVDGLPVTSVTRTLADVARLLPRMQAVACLDSALDLKLVEQSSLPDIAQLMRRKPLCVSARRRLAECRVGAQSPLETRVRLRATDEGLPPDELQVPVVSPAGAVLGYGDMGYRLPDGRWLIVEADGRSVHELPEAVLHDRRRQNSFNALADVSVLRFTWPDTQSRLTIPNVLRPLLEREGWRPNPRRS